MNSTYSIGAGAVPLSAVAAGDAASATAPAGGISTLASRRSGKLVFKGRADDVLAQLRAVIAAEERHARRRPSLNVPWRKVPIVGRCPCVEA